MKRIFCFVVLLILLCMLFACGESEQTTTIKAESTTTTTQKASVTTTTTTKITIPVTIISPDGYTYVLDDKGAAIIIDYFGTETSVEIPQTVGDKQVVEIGFEAFRDSKVKSVIVPFGIKKIDAYAFFNSSLESIVIPDTVTFIGNNAFSYTNLTELETPMGISTISAEAFSFCEHLESVIIGSNVTEIEDDAFAFCQSLEAVYIPYSVDYIADNAFSGWFDGLVIYGEEDSYAQQYAEDMGMEFEIV